MKARSVQLYLASTSPRRQELLEQMGLSFDLVAQHVDESRRPGEPAEEYVQRLAREKALAGLQNLPGQSAARVLGADTVVLCEGQVLGKPRDGEHAVEMLRLLAGRRHRVLTAVALVAPQHCKVLTSSTQVEFCSLSEAEITAYRDSGEPQGKAGAYAIQGRGALFVKSIMGSYSGVMGLPVFETAQLLGDFGLDLTHLLAGSRG